MCSGDEGLAWWLHSAVDPLRLPVQPPPSINSISTYSPPTPCQTRTSPFPPAVGDGFSESSWDGDQRQITADVYAKCNMELTPTPCPHPQPPPPSQLPAMSSLLISLPLSGSSITSSSHCSIFCCAMRRSVNLIIII